jgi:hypothetical protein
MATQDQLLWAGGNKNWLNGGAQATPQTAQWSPTPQPQTFAAPPQGQAVPQTSFAPPQQGILSGSTIPTPQAYAPPPVMQAEYKDLDPNLRTVQSNETVLGQLNGILSADSPLLQQARARAAENAQSRGLLNSTMGVQAGESAVLGKALEIATPDAATYAEAAKGNQNAINTIALANQAEFGQTSRTNATAGNQRSDRMITESGLNTRQVQELNATMDRTKLTEAGAMERTRMTEAGAMDRTKLTEAGATERSRMQNDTQMAVTRMNNDVSLATANMSRQTQIEVAGMQQATSMNIANMQAENSRLLQSSSAANSIVRDYASQASQIMQNPDMDGATRQRALQNLQEIANSGLKLAGSVQELDLEI